MIELYTGGNVPAEQVSELQRLKPVQLAELVVAALPRASHLDWRHMADQRVVWITRGLEEQGEKTARTGLIRVTMGTRTSTVLDRRISEVPWTVRLSTDDLPKFGPQQITIFSGRYEEPCWGSMYDNCTFTAEEAFSLLPQSRQICVSESIGGEIVARRLTDPKWSRSVVVYSISRGSGGESSTIDIYPETDERRDAEFCSLT